MKSIKIIAHRGASDVAPENTLSAFKKACKLGADVIEFDVHETKDGVLVIHHDYALGYPDNGKGLIYTKTYAQIQSVDAGSWFSKIFRNEPIPTLDQVFALARNKCAFEIELKGATQQFLDTVLNVVNKYNLLSSIEFTSPHIPLLSTLKQGEPRAQIGLFIQPYPEWMSKALGEKLVIDTMTLMFARVAHLPLSLINSKFVKTLRQRDLIVHAADCNTKEDLLTAKELIVDQVSTNHITLAQKVLRS